METNKIKIYTASQEDANILKSLRCKLVTENPRTYGDSPQSECSKPVSEYENWIKEYNTNTGAIFLLEIDNELVGMCAIKKEETEDAVAYMGSLGILKEYQGKGYGHLLIDKRIEFAKAQNFKRIKTITTKENARMVSILTEVGFKITGEGEYKGIPEYYLELGL